MCFDWSAKSLRCLFSVGIVTLLVMKAEPAWAVQAHGGVEGLVSHQIGHMLFMVGIGSLLFHVHRARLRTPGWTEFRIFIWLLLVWNVITFTGHWMHEFVDVNKYVRAGENIVSFSVMDIADVYFYLTRLDHLFLVPSLVFLLLALKKWRMQG